MKVRTIKTGSKKTAVQVVRYERGRTIVLHHVGTVSRRNDLSSLLQSAQEWMTTASGQQSFFPFSHTFDPLFSRYRYIGARYSLLYETLSRSMDALGFGVLDRMLRDLVLIRVVEPSSKRRSVELLFSYFGITYDLTTLYRYLPEMSKEKDQAESFLVTYARKHLGFTFSFVLYDVTTLYFESFTADELRTLGFSKDNKVNQPQVVVGLLVNLEGFPLAYDVFTGKTFEGHTILPVITALVTKYAIKSLTVVADAAMLSEENTAALQDAGLSYIVGARLQYLNTKQVETLVTPIAGCDHATTRMPYAGYTLIGEFSQSRYTKDKRDTERYVKKAQSVIDGKTPPKKHRFLSGNQGTYTLNQSLINRITRLWGVKGYITNLDLPDTQIIVTYHSLWQVEKSFRMAKSDLLARPIFHHKQQAIRAHLLICVLALAVGKYLETKTRLSLRRVLELLIAVPDARIIHKATGEETGWRAEIPDETKQLLKNLGVTY